MNNPKVAISIVTWNSEAFIVDCLKSVFQQTFKDFSVTIVDNASRDRTVQRIQEEYPHVKILRHSVNLGFSRAHNHAMNLTRTPFVLVLNPDMILDPEYLRIMVDACEDDASLGSAQGKICRFAVAQGDDLRQPIPSDILDSTGIAGTASRSFKNRGEGEQDTGQYDDLQDIFGPTGACAFYRRDALMSVQYGHEFFDEDFFAYVEDSDLAWRLQLHGWHSRYVPLARAWHYRNIRGAETTRATLSARTRRPLSIRQRATTNAIGILIKNLDGATFRKNFFRIVGHEMLRLGYLIVREPRVVSAYWQLIRLVPRLRRKRRIIQRHRSVQPDSLHRYFI